MPTSARMLATLQRLMEIPAADLRTALVHATNALADALAADKVDAFLYDETRDSLVVAGVSTQPLSDLQQKLGLDVLQLSNGGRCVSVYRTGKVFRCGDVQNDAQELKGIRDGLGIQSQLGVPLDVGGTRRGVVMVASLKRDHFSAEDEQFAISAVRWIGAVAHRAELVARIERNALEQGRRSAAEEIVTVLAHDLRNHISPLTLRLYAMRHRAERDQRAECLADANAGLRGIGRLGALVGNLLDVARLDRGLFELEVQAVDLVQLLREAANALSTPDHQIVVTASDVAVVRGDAARLRQCVENLLSNAIYHSPDSAPVNVVVTRAHRDGCECVDVEIIDEGPGVPEELRAHLFEPFVSGRARQGGVGLGLGLYLARRIAQAHDGELTVDRAPGKGARFLLSLPLYAGV